MWLCFYKLTIRYTKNPISAFKALSSSPLKGATITRVVDLGEQGMELVITTKDGKQIAGEFHIKNPVNTKYQRGFYL